jgi:beta-glucosidase/6-phospho-beta-glucosidase/beta-galactosidase
VGRGLRAAVRLVWVDFATGERTPKESARWYGRVATENGFEA